MKASGGASLPIIGALLGHNDSATTQRYAHLHDDPLKAATEAVVSTSYVERMNLNIRMGNRRFTRLTNAFSKKVDNHLHMLSLYFCHYNFCRIHKTLRVSGAHR